MKNLAKVLFGMLFIVLGLIIGVNALGIAEINIFFDGWWTLFIIIPSLIALFDDCDKEGPLICLILGIVLLLVTRGILDFELVFKLLIPFILVVIGISIIANEIFGSKVKEKAPLIKEGEIDYISAILKEETRIISKTFKGATIDSVFGHAIVDLRKAKFTKEAALKVSAIFASVDIIVPKDTEVKIKATKVFGSVEKLTFKSDTNDKEKTIYIDAFSMFGSINIK